MVQVHHEVQINRNALTVPSGPIAPPGARRYPRSVSDDPLIQAREAFSRELLGAEMRQTEVALANLSRAVQRMQTRVDEWGRGRPSSVPDEIFLLQTMHDLGELKRRSDAAIKQLSIQAVRDRGLSARTVGRELGIAHTTITRWLMDDPFRPNLHGRGLSREVVHGEPIPGNESGKSGR